MGKNIAESVKLDKFGNPLGEQFDLAKDGAFNDFIVAVLHLYTGERFDFKLPTKALKEKGFDVIRWTALPTIKVFKETLDKACQLWVISNSYEILKKGHLDVIKRYFEMGHGIYILGDNEPYYADANVIGKALFGTGMEGNVPGDKVVSKQENKGARGFVPHLITTGLNNLYEGVTIATIEDSKDLNPLVIGSDNNLVTAVYDKNGKRAIIDGGFTRLFCHWDTAGTGRYVKNAAAWLSNHDQWGRGSHLADRRDTTGVLKLKEESPPFHFYNSKKSDLSIGGFWEKEATVVISVFNPKSKKVKEERSTGAEHYFNVNDAIKGIWSASIKFESGVKDEYQYVLTLEMKEED